MDVYFALQTSDCSPVKRSYFTHYSEATVKRYEANDHNYTEQERKTCNTIFIE